MRFRLCKKNKPWEDFTWIEREYQVPCQDFTILEDRVEVIVGADCEMFADDWELLGVGEVDNRRVGGHVNN